MKFPGSEPVPVPKARSDDNSDDNKAQMAQNDKDDAKNGQDENSNDRGHGNQSSGNNQNNRQNDKQDRNNNDRNSDQNNNRNRNQNHNNKNKNGKNQQNDSHGHKGTPGGLDEARDINKTDDAVKDKLKGKDRGKGHGTSDNIKNAAGGDSGGKNGDTGNRNPVNDLSKKLGKKALKKSPKVAAEGMMLYAGGKLFDKLKKGLGLLAGKAGDLATNVLAHSAVGGMLNALHSLAGLAANALHAIGHGINVAMHFVGGLIHGAGAALGAIGHGIATGVAHIGSALGVSTVQAAAMTGASAILITGGAIGGTMVMLQNNGQKDAELENNCLTDVQSAADGDIGVGDGKSVNATKKQIESVHHMYDFFHTLGWTNEAIAALAGNAGVESGEDPTQVQGMSGIEPFVLGPKKRAAMGPSAVGLGLWQWSNTRHTTFLQTAKKAHKRWYDEEFQLAYVMAEPGISFDFDHFKKMKDLKSAIVYWEQHWEVAGVPNMDDRIAFGEQYLDKMKNWKADKSYAHSVMALSKSLGGGKGMTAGGGGYATQEAVGDALANCAQAKSGGGNNSSLAMAAISYAYDTQDEGKGNNGTPLYRTVHDAVYPGDNWYQSCDRGVACAIMWTGTDLAYPPGATDSQHRHLESSNRWKKIGTSESMKEKDLKPGDIFNSSGNHTFMYVGKAAIREAIKEGIRSHKTNPNDDAVSASYQERSPGCGVDAAYTLAGHDGRHFDIYRCVKPQHSSKYKNVGKKYMK